MLLGRFAYSLVEISVYQVLTRSEKADDRIIPTYSVRNNTLQICAMLLLFSYDVRIRVCLRLQCIKHSRRQPFSYRSTILIDDYNRRPTISHMLIVQCRNNSSR